MTMNANLHETLLYEELKSLKEQGWRVMDIRHTLPDAIVISPDGKVIAVEILGRKKRIDTKGRSKGYQWDGGKNVNLKRWLYQNYDDIIFVLFDRNGSGWKKRIVASEEWKGFREGG